MLSKIWNNCCQEKWKVMSKLWAKPVSILPTALLASRLASCLRVHPVPLCFTALPTLLHISTSSFCPSFAWCEFWHAGPALASSSTLLHFLPLARWPGCPAGAACSPPGQLACLMAPFIRPAGEGWGSHIQKRWGFIVDFIGIVIK